MSDASAIQEPHKVIDALFEQHIQQNSGNKPDGDFGVAAHFKSIITDSNISNVSKAEIELVQQRHTLC